MKGDQLTTSNAVIKAEETVLINALKPESGWYNSLVERGVSRESFSVSSNRYIWDAIGYLFSAGQIVELTSVVSRLEAAGRLEDAGGLGRVAEFAAYPSDCDFIRESAFSTMQRHNRRMALMTFGNEVVSTSLDLTLEPEDALARTEQLMSGLRDKCGVEKDLPIGEVCKVIVDELEWQMKHPGEIIGYSTGFNGLDRYIDGLVGGRMIVIAARPGVGKTALLVNIFTNCSLRGGLKVGLFSLEMPRKEIVKRVIFSEARFNPEGLRLGRGINKGEMMRMNKAMLDIKAAEIVINDRPALSIDRLQASARRMVREQGVKILGVDYIGLMRGVTRQSMNQREREISEITGGLKALAKELNVPVIALSQLNRDVEKREKGVPRLSDLRESGSIEQDADQVIFIHRPWLSDKGADPREANFILAKNRHGSTGIIKGVWDAEFTTYSEVNRYESQGYSPSVQEEWEAPF